MKKCKSAEYLEHIDGGEVDYATEVVQEVSVEDLILCQCETGSLLEYIVTALSKLHTF